MTAPAIHPTTKRAIDEWTAKGCAVEVALPDGTRLRITPPTAQDDLDLIDFARGKK